MNDLVTTPDIYTSAYKAIVRKSTSIYWRDMVQECLLTQQTKHPGKYRTDLEFLEDHFKLLISILRCCLHTQSLWLPMALEMQKQPVVDSFSMERAVYRCPPCMAEKPSICASTLPSFDYHFAPQDEIRMSVYAVQDRKAEKDPCSE